MFTLARVSVLKQSSTVELHKPMLIAREMRRHPVDDYRQASCMTAVHQVAKVVGRTEALRRCEQPDRLIAPRSVKRVLTDWQEFNVSESHLAYVVDEFVGEISIRQVTAVVLVSPGARMNFVD